MVANNGKKQPSNATSFTPFATGYQQWLSVTKRPNTPSIATCFTPFAIPHQEWRLVAKVALALHRLPLGTNNGYRWQNVRILHRLPPNDTLCHLFHLLTDFDTVFHQLPPNCFVRILHRLPLLMPWRIVVISGRFTEGWYRTANRYRCLIGLRLSSQSEDGY